VEMSPATDQMSPRDDLEAKLVEIWQEVLGRPNVGVQDNFFDLGGSSLLAVRVQARIEKELGVRLSLAALFQAPTVGSLAGQLSGPGAPPYGLYLTHAKGSLNQPVLFCLAWLGLARRLAQHLEPHWPVYGTDHTFDEEFQRWRKDRHVTLTLETVAARNLAIIRHIQPQGPYFLLGFCFSGVLAFEVARQLQAQGERVALLALLESSYLPGLKPRALPKLQRFAHYARLAVGKGPAQLVESLRRKMATEAWRKSHPKMRLWGLLTGTWKRRDGAQREEAGWLQPEFVTPMLQAYRGQPYQGRTVLFRAMQRGAEYQFHFSETDGWNAVLTQGVQVEEIPGDHIGMTEEPHVGDLAKRLTYHLAHSAATEVRPQAG